MERREFEIVGTSPLMVSCDRLANPLDPLKKELATYTSKRNKTDDDIEAIYKLEWEAGLYYNDGKPIMPTNCIKAMIRSAAKLNKLGKNIQRGVVLIGEEVPILYPGPKDRESMWKSGNFSDIRSCKVKQSKVMRCRPIFNDWSLIFTLALNESIMDMKEIVDILILAGEIEGLCENRINGFGRFEVK